jgi:hypothetical protein
MTRLLNADVLNNLTGLKDDVKAYLGNDPDLVFRHAGNAVIIYISGLVDSKRLEHEIIEQLSTSASQAGTVSTPELQETNDFDVMIKALLSGIVVVAAEGAERVLLANLALFPHRNIQSPQSETVIFGPQEGFTEMLETNVALIRRRLKTDKLRMKVWQIGTFSPTEVRLIYLEGVARQEVVEEMINRISDIQIDAVLDSNYIEEYVKDHKLSIFPTLQRTERPDVVTGSLLEGKISILTDNSPFAILAPLQFWTAFQSSEDYYLPYSSAAFLRLIRAISSILALLLPSLYVAITTYHPDMLPTNLLLSFSGARELSPFPAVVEAFLMEFTFEALREAVIRLPRAMGQTVSIVGALVIGQAVVQAGIISTPMVIVVSITGISSLMIPRYSMTFPIRILRLVFLILAGSLGLVGILFGLFTIGIYLTGIRSVGTLYLGPIAPLSLSGLKDFLVRVPYPIVNRKKAARAKQQRGARKQ